MSDCRCDPLVCPSDLRGSSIHSPTAATWLIANGIWTSSDSLADLWLDATLDQFQIDASSAWAAVPLDDEYASNSLSAGQSTTRSTRR